MRQGMGKLQRANVVGIFLRTCVSPPCLMSPQMKTHKPIPTADDTLSTRSMFAKCEHVQLPFLDDNKNVQPSFTPCPLSRRLIVLLAAQHAFFGPRGSEKRKLFVCDTDRGIHRLVAMCAPIVVLLCLTYDRVRQVRGKAKRRC